MLESIMVESIVKINEFMINVSKYEIQHGVFF